MPWLNQVIDKGILGRVEGGLMFLGAWEACFS